MTLAYLASNLEKTGHSVSVYDCIAQDISTESLLAQVRTFNPEIALINTTTPSINADLLFVAKFKEHFPESHISVFGIHVTALHTEIMNTNQAVDSVIRNEPEWNAVELAAALQSGVFGEHGIAGCTVRINGTVIAGEEREYSKDLDSLAYPAWGHFDLSLYQHPVFNKPYVMVNTSRGCVHNCIFCVASQFYGKKVRYRSVASILDEIEHHVIEKYGVRHIWMYADDFTCSTAFVKELCRGIIDRNLKIVWWTNTRVDNHDREMFQLMRRAGCFMLSIGGESGNAEILKRIRKGTKPENIRKTVALLRDEGINSLVYFLIGLPGETRHTINETIAFAKAINPDYVEYYPATPYPGTEFFSIYQAENCIVDANWDNYMCGGNEFVIKVPGLSKAELDKILKQAYREYYIRPGYLQILLKRMIRPAEFVRLIGFGMGYFSRFFSK